MQLEDRRGQLAMAVCALLGGGAVHAQPAPAAASPDNPAAVIDSGFLWYQESNQRIRDAEVIVNVRQPLPDERSWNAHLTIDSVCGGSPIGALPSKASQHFVTPTATSLYPAIQTTTSASGGGDGGSFSLCTSPVQNQQYDVAPGQLPIDQSFHDQRFALSGGYEAPLARLSRLTVGGALSHETDFQSASVNGSLARDLDNRNTTLSAGLNLEADSINPVGGTPVALSPYGLFQKGGNRSRQLQDLLLSGTQVVTRRWLAQVNLSFERSSGYHTDPYKIVTQVDAQGNDAAGQYVYENRPDARRRVALFWDNRYAFDTGVLQASYRRTQDSWGLHTDTFEAHYRQSFGWAGYLEPHWRGYRQNAADFFRFYLDQGAGLPSFVSADPRLAAFHAQTLGVKYGLPISDTGEASLRVERYAQNGSGPATALPGLQGLDLYPGLRAWIVQLGLRATF